MRKKIVAVVMIIFLFVAGFLIVGPRAILDFYWSTLPPNVEVTSHNLRRGMTGLDFVVWIDVSVYNSGGPGNVTVGVRAGQKGIIWDEAQTVYLRQKESKELTFTFEVFWNWSSESDAVRYTVSLEY